MKTRNVLKKALSLMLALALVCALCPAVFAAQVMLSPQKLTVDGRTINCEKYNIDGSNYFKLRDLAYVLNGTGSQFQVGYDAAAGVVSITTGSAYTANGSELVVGADKSSTAVPSSQTIKINGKVRADLSVYNIGGNNFFKLRDLGDALGFGVDYNAATNTAIVLSWIVYSGEGSRVISNVNIPAGSYYAEYVYSGERNFISKLYYGDGEYDYLSLTNKIGKCSGRVEMSDNDNKAIRNGMLEVMAYGSWTITFKPVSGSTTLNIKGTGETVTGIFTAPTSRLVINGNYSGEHNFIVKILKYNATAWYDYESVFNEIGSYSGQKIVQLQTGARYFIYVYAEGDWTLDFGRGDALTTYTPPVISASQGGTEGGSEDGKYSYADATYLNNCASKATTATTDALNYVNKSFSGTAEMQAMYLNSAITKVKLSRDYMQDAIDRLDGKLDIELTGSDFSTLLELVQANYDLLDSVAGLSANAGNVDDIRSELLSVIPTAGARNLAFQKVTVQLLGAFA